MLCKCNINHSINTCFFLSKSSSLDTAWEKDKYCLILLHVLWFNKDFDVQIQYTVMLFTVMHPSCAVWLLFMASLLQLNLSTTATMGHSKQAVERWLLYSDFIKKKVKGMDLHNAGAK